MIYICIPTHNEQQTVGVVLWKLKQVLTDFPRDYQLLVADDASTDKTAEVLEPYTRVLPLTVIRSEQRQGSAASLEMLLREAVRRSEYPKRDAIITLQADFSEEPDDLVPLVKRLEAGADVAVGNKVSTSRETRARRFARSLARFFLRRQKWPEGVMTPFDGYRAYRLYAVKRAMEERGTGRLLRYDGWAGSAELLRAVLPHARRVDVVDVDDRPDRLQRPRRERPFAAAMQVRTMASGAEPERLVGVAELDRIALTTSRSRERAAITAQSIHAERGSASRTNGSRARQNGQRREQGRTSSQSNGGARAGNDSRARRERPQQAESTKRKRGEARSTQARPKRSGGQRPPRDEPTPGSPEQADLPATASTEAANSAPDAAARPKRKRRRRKRGGQGRTASEGQGQATPQDTAAAGAGDGDAARTSPSGADAAPESNDQRADGRAAAGPARADSVEGRRAEAPGDGAGSNENGSDDASSTGTGGTEAAGEGKGTKKRRRRGGRRGGRGRRRPRPDGAVESAAGSGGESSSSAAERSEAAGSADAAGRGEADSDRGAGRPVAESGARADEN